MRKYHNNPVFELNIYTVLRKNIFPTLPNTAQVIQKKLVGENFLETILFLVKNHFCGNQKLD